MKGYRPFAKHFKPVISEDNKGVVYSYFKSDITKDSSLREKANGLFYVGERTRTRVKRTEAERQSRSR
jgi:hypothetical protein